MTTSQQDQGNREFSHNEGPDVPSCGFCRHYRRYQRGPHLWDVDCTLGQATFPNARDCAFYDPPPRQESGRETGLGYVWDCEFEGPA